MATEKTEIKDATSAAGATGSKAAATDVPRAAVAGKVTALNFSGGEPRLTVTLTSGAVLSDVSLSNLVSVH